MHVITCCGICHCLAGDARWRFLKLVSGIRGRRRWAAVATCHVMCRVRRAVVILCILTLAKAGIRWIVLANQTTQEQPVRIRLLLSVFRT